MSQPLTHHLTAGREYLEALQRLDLDPEGLMWAVDKESGQKVLLLVTGLFDLAGPLKLSELLFRAYNASATPQEIDPFIVETHSPEQTFVSQLYLLFNAKVQPGIEIKDETMSITVGSYVIFKPWVYQLKKPETRKVALTHRLQRFERKVQALKAA